MISIGTEAIFWIGVFVLVILANLINWWVHRKKRNRRIVPAMYVARKPVREATRGSIQSWRESEGKRP